MEPTAKNNEVWVPENAVNLRKSPVGATFSGTQTALFFQRGQRLAAKPLGARPTAVEDDGESGKYDDGNEDDLLHGDLLGSSAVLLVLSSQVSGAGAIDAPYVWLSVL